MSVMAAATRTKPGADRQRWFCDFNFTAKAPDPKTGDLVLEGYASTWVEDRDQEYVAPEAFDNSLSAYMAKNPMLLWQHNQDWPIGAVLAAAVDDTGLRVRAVVPKPEVGEPDWKHGAYHSIRKGIVRTFSIGGLFTREIRGDRRYIVEVELLEISTVSVPSNPDSIFAAAVKALYGPHRPDLPSEAVVQMEQLLGMRHVSDPGLATMDAAAKALRYEELAAMYTAAGHRPPGKDAWQAASSIADPHKRLQAVVDVMRQVRPVAPAPAAQGDKRGRVLSAANEAALRNAVEVLQAVLAKLATDAPDDDEPPEGEQGPPQLQGVSANEVRGAEGLPAAKATPPHLRAATATEDDSPTKKCGTCKHWGTTSEGGETTGFCKLYKYPTKQGQVCDSYASAKAAAAAIAARMEELSQELAAAGAELVSYQVDLAEGEAKHTGGLMLRFDGAQGLAGLRVPPDAAA